MKANMFAFFLFVALDWSRGAWAAPPEEEKRVLTLVRKAFDNNESKILEDLTHWEGVTPESRKKLADFYVGSIKAMRSRSGRLESAKIVAAEPKDAEQSVTMDGTPHKLNLVVSYQLELKGSSGAVQQWALGEKGGKLLLVTFIPAKK